MTNTPDPTFSASVELFVSASPWLGDAHAPAVTTLRVLAKSLDDGNLTPALVAQFGLTQRSLAKLAPKAEPKKSPLAAAIEEARER